MTVLFWIIIFLMLIIICQFIPYVQKIASDVLFGVARRLNPITDDKDYHLPEDLQSPMGGPTCNGPDPSSPERFVWKDGVVQVQSFPK